ncbi:hypothetical protein L6452_27289 [Arctium lappa]|uniref:Uncharacterized protein n=1 Tax=Arctium lappa TaxID=4217 RepID=A0ACB8ZVZ6_ARCLA|nr:hypothetical protein L6452_27289 [Arctium lappa]
MKPPKSPHSQTLPSSPIHHHHHSSSDFEFTATLSPPKSITTNLRPVDELFYNGQLLPLHLSSSPSNSMLCTTLLTSTGRHSSFSYDTSDSSLHSSATDQDHNHLPHKLFAFNSQTHKLICNQENKVLARGNNFPFNRFSSVFRKETKHTSATHSDPATITVKTMSVTAKEKIRKYLKKVKPLYEKLSQLQKTTPPPPMAKRDDVVLSPSFPGNLRFLRRTSCVSSCPSTMPSSPTHSGVICRKIIASGYMTNQLSSSTEELQSAIQGAISHCKNSMNQTGWRNK